MSETIKLKIIRKRNRNGQFVADSNSTVKEKEKETTMSEENNVEINEEKISNSIEDVISSANEEIEKTKHRAIGYGALYLLGAAVLVGVGIWYFNRK